MGSKPKAPRPDEDHYYVERCVCVHLSSQHDASPAGCWWCSDCTEFRGPAVPERKAS